MNIFLPKNIFSFMAGFYPEHYLVRNLSITLSCNSQGCFEIDKCPASFSDITPILFCDFRQVTSMLNL